MVPAPVDLAAGGALLEMADELAGARFEQVQDVALYTSYNKPFQVISSL